MGRPSLLPSIAIVLAGLAVGVTGCGDDTSSDKADTTTTAKALSSDALREQADKICAQVQDDINALDAPTELADLETMAPKVLTISEKGVAELKDLAPSADDKAIMTELIGLLEESNAALAKVGAAAKDGDEAAATAALDESTAKQDEFNAAADKAGFGGCGTMSEESDGTDASDDTTDTTEATDAGDTPFADIDLGEKLNAIDGFTYETLPDEARQALLSTFASSPEVTDLVAAVGTTTVTSDGGTSLLVFLGLNRELSADESQQLVDGITAGGMGLEQGEIAGQTGWAYVGADGAQGFVTVRTDTVIIGQSDSTDHLAAVITGLFAANPDL